jgi:hexosaminidase
MAKFNAMNPKRHLLRTAGSMLILLLLFSCKQTPEIATNLAAEALIPKPVTIEATGSAFSLKPVKNLYISPDNAGVRAVAGYLSERLNPGLDNSITRILPAPKNLKKGNICLILDSTLNQAGEEGYELAITEKLVTVKAPHPAGLFYGVQTLLQLLPASLEKGTPLENPAILPTGVIRDWPEYSYRGAMLDVARHFFPPQDVKRLIDLMARYKMNRLHLHLSDDQGWRIEIKSWPNLAQHGGSTQVGGGKGGFYTQEDYAGIVKYAADRFITIVPEIDMPGHTNAALASYAELNCNGKATNLYTGTNVGFSTLCTNKEITYQFISDVFRELAGLTPGPWIHIGGDESHVTKLEDYIPFINRVQEIVASVGKQTMGWDDIAIATLKPGAVAQHWAKVENAVKAAGQGSKLLLSPASKAYLDMKYDSTTTLGLKWAGYIEVDTAYIWDPATYVPGISKKDILGIEAPLWSETVTTMDEIEFMVFPRLQGFAEIGWTPASMRTWDEYKTRLGKHGPRMEALDIDFYKSPKVPWQ